jgi:bla regulator protein blaR1
MTVLIGIAFKSLLIAGLTLCLLELMKHRSAAERSWIAHAGLFALVLMAVAPVAMPKNWTVEAPAILGTVQATEAPAAPLPTTATGELRKGGKVDVNALVLSTVRAKTAAARPPVSTGSRLSASAATMVLYAIPAVVLLFITFLALARLVALQAKAEVLVDGHWLSALARAQRRMGFKHGTALLTSNELASPISWGLMRPVIVLNARAVEAQGEAEAIIAHELAHVARMDWIKLLLARVATALFWFNPLVWVLAREAHQLREEAADDAVLGADISDTDYAELLVGVARHDCPGLLLGAHGVAPSKSSLARRVARVLDSKIMRGPVAGSFAAGVFVGAVAIAAPLAALTLVPSGTSSVQKAAVASTGKKSAYAPYYPEATPTDLPSIISAGVTTSVQSAVAAINPAVRVGPGSDFEATSPSGASVLTINGVTVATAASGATTTIYPADAHGRSRVVARAANGATAMSYVDANEAREMARAAHNRQQDSAIETAISMKALGMTPEWINAIKAASPALNGADVDDLMGMKAVGVTPEYVRELGSAGFGNLDVSDLTEARAVGVTGEYIQAMRAAGLGGTLDEFVEMRAVGVTPTYADQFRRAGYKLSLEKLVELKAHNIDIEELRRAPPTPPRPPAPPGHKDDADDD